VKKTVVMLVIVALLVAIALYVFYQDSNDSLSTANHDEVQLSADELKGLRLLRLAQEACLAGESSDVAVNIDLSTDYLTSFKQVSGVHKDKTRGAINYVDEKVRSIVDKEIRECLQKHMPQIQACLLGDCSTASLPKAIDFRFTYQQLHENPYLEKNLVSFGLENSIDNHTLIKQPGKGYYVDAIPLLAQGKKRNAAIFGVVRESYVPDYNEHTNFCLRRAAALPDAGNFTLFHCKQGEGCQHEVSTPKWFELCSSSAIGRTDTFSPLDPLPSLITTAYAEGERAWAIPTLKTLQQREDLFGIGYTHFKLQADSAMNKNYDGYYYDITVNGWQANINGMAGSFRAQAHDFSKPVAIEFGLQNLNFSGVNDGCDEIAVTLNFVKDGESAGKPITLRRSYVALRDARIKELDADHIHYRWTGKYQRAPKMYDTEVFVSSILVASNLDFQANRAAIAKAKDNISRMKRDFDALGISFDGRPLVAVIRPPLTQISYGLAIGMVEETQQIRFTYDRDTASRLRQFLLQLRSRGGSYRSTIAHDTFLYSVRGDKSYMASPPVCADDAG
jgi:hypothetical protein